MTTTNTLDRIFNGYSLLSINIVIIVLALTVGGGLYFFETGLIHLIALLFIALALLRMFYHHYTYDPILEKFVHASLFALLVFAGSHVIEYVSMMFLNRYVDAVFENVANFYLISTFAIIAGATHFSSINHKTYSSFLRKFSYAVIVGLFLLALFLLANDRAILLDTASGTSYAYAGMLAIAGALTSIEILRIRRLTPIMHGFTTYLLGALFTILVAILPNIFYEALGDAGVPSYVSIYASHFLFYAALSLFFLAFKKMAYLGGVYEDLKALDVN
ncbi:MAG: hypothetical protein PHV99_03035 [Candidatus Pacebacteria bacterium]|nr:hypothetical protein [Candidatus Paceibacterota bacterium]